MEDDINDPMKMIKEMLNRDRDKDVLNTCTETTLALMDMCLQYKKKPKQIIDMFNHIYRELVPIKR